VANSVSSGRYKHTRVTVGLTRVVDSVSVAAISSPKTRAAALFSAITWASDWMSSAAAMR